MSERLVFSITKQTNNSNLNRADNPLLPDPFVGGMLYLYKSTPSNITLQLRHSTDRLVQIRSMYLSLGEAKDLANALNKLLTEIEPEGVPDPADPGAREE